jgi:hypothetical protein
MLKKRIRSPKLKLIALLLAFLVLFWFCISFVHAKETPKPTLQAWQINGIVAALDDGYAGVKQSAFRKVAEFDAKSFAAFPKQSEEIAKRAIALVNDRTAEFDLRSSAAGALGELGKADAAVVQALTTLLNDRTAEFFLRSLAAGALGKLGKADAAVVQALTTLLNDRTAEPYLRRSAAGALGKLGKADAAVVQALTTLLNDRTAEFDLRSLAAGALGELGKTDAAVVQFLTTLVNDRTANSNLRSSAVWALGNLRQLNLSEVLVGIDRTYDVADWQLHEARFNAYFYGRGDKDIQTLLRWIGRPDFNSIPRQLTHADAKHSLEVFAKAWEASANFPRIRSELAQAIANVARMVQWQLGDIALLEQHHKNLSAAKLNSADSVQAAIDALAIWKWFNTVRDAIALHALFWVVLIGLYPKFPTIQALFFWNPWMRSIAGLGYVSALFVLVPFLQRRLFAPFRTDLRQAAGLEQFDPTAYFPASRVKSSIWKAGKEIEATLPLTEAIPSLKGQIILQAPSGFGKTMFLRHLINQSPQRIIVFLTATECAQAPDHDVVRAIQAKLPIAASDPDFLKSLIYSGAIDICIDGLNEVNAEVQASIKQFLSSYTKGNIILTTQPFSDKNPPRSARLYRLLPLDDPQIHTFLTSRQPETAQLQGAAYQQVCEAYLNQALNPQLPAEDLEANRRVLSNPMDLDIVAEMLAQAETPDLFRLQKQLYDRAASEYQSDNNGFPFPLQDFSELAYTMRLNDQNLLPPEELEQLEPGVVASLEKHKLLTPKYNSYQFRHDKIWDFFIVQKYLRSQSEACQELQTPERLQDTRLRGVYLQLALELDLPIAQTLEKALFDYASRTGDHTTSDPFRKRLDSRPELRVRVPAPV